jgi:hypothetical protein
LLVVALFLSLAAGLFPAIALAQTEPSEAQKEEARQLYHQGNEQYAAKDFRAALIAFEKAHAIVNAPTTGLGVGKCQEKVGLLLEAVATLQAVASYPRRPGEPDSFTEAREEAAELGPGIEKRIPSVSVQVSGVKPGVAITILVDAAAVADDGQVHRVNPGSHQVSVAAAGYTDGKATISVSESENKVVSVSLAPLPSGDGGNGDEGTDPSADNLAVQATMWAGFGLGVAGIAIGSITGGMSLSATSDVDGMCRPDGTCPETAREEHERALDLANVSNVGFAIGAAGVIVGIIALIVIITDDSPPATANAGLELSLDGSGLNLKF